MEKTKNKVEAQGADTQDYDVPTIKSMLTVDLRAAITCLNAIQSDPDLLENLAVFMHGRFTNARHQQSPPKK